MTSYVFLAKREEKRWGRPTPAHDHKKEGEGSQRETPRVWTDERKDVVKSDETGKVDQMTSRTEVCLGAGMTKRGNEGLEREEWGDRAIETLWRIIGETRLCGKK